MMRSVSRRPSRRGWQALGIPLQLNRSRRGSRAALAQWLRSAVPRKRSRAKGIDKAALALPEPRRVRDRDHVRYVAKQPCLVCGRSPCDGHHLRFAQSRALGRKVSDEFVVPLCRGHHREVHRHGDEGAWWRSVGIDPIAVARALWLETHPMATNPQRLRTVAAVAPETGSLERTNAGAQRGSNRAKRNMKPIQDTASRNGVT